MTVVARVSLDMLGSRASRREEPEASLYDRGPSVASEGDPEPEPLLADSVGAALLVVLDTLSPAEELAFMLHDTFGVPFDEVGSILGRSPSAAKQLASRGRVDGGRAAEGGVGVRVLGWQDRAQRDDRPGPEPLRPGAHGARRPGGAAS